MFTLAQINLGFNPASLIGLFYMLFSIIYFISMIVFLRRSAKKLSNSAIIFYVIQAIFASFLMLISGVILTFQGWRLDPILQFGEFCLLILVIYLSVKDVVTNVIKSSRRL
ncbi:Ycf66 family protein [Mastigocoleus testarum]|uniref:Ycf66 family protein n=1 Tax=Mastigocoleus testarum BC008 TaxID=371196 RepID=A0A0V7ZPP4_9CYAN|nr:Ycf66 family protein [Mastigocoleus testarum]KST66410.1 hypothetical protein BC008_42500 [Mastigocoleus testarum BC008]